MARQVDRLNARTVKTLGPGLHADGGGLYLRVEPAGARRWMVLFRHRGKRCEMGLGPLATMSLVEAREAALQARRQAQAGKSPVEERRRQEAAVKAVTFGELAEQMVEDLMPQWRNPKVAQQWRTTLTVDAAALGPKLVSEITTEDVLGVLKSIWVAKRETAGRLRGRIERILDAAKARGMRTGENVARWKGHLALLLPRMKRQHQHFAALPYAEIQPFMAAVRRSERMSALALDFTILTASRTSEVLGAMGCEFNLRESVWTVPGSRMKSGRDHRVPLSPPALAIALARIEVAGQGLLFPGLKRGRPLSNMAMSKMLPRLGYDDITVHGFRSTFRDWAGDRTDFPREIIEAALAHIVGDESEQAYRRSDALERRRKLMESWAKYCELASSAVIPIRA